MSRRKSDYPCLHVVPHVPKFYFHDALDMTSQGTTCLSAHAYYTLLPGFSIILYCTNAKQYKFIVNLISDMEHIT